MDFHPASAEFFSDIPRENDGSIENMGVKYEDGSVCYIIGITKAIRAKINKGDGDQVHVIIKERE